MAGGTGDSIVGNTGSMELDIASNLGAETVNLGATTHGATIIRDVSASGGTANTTIMGFSTGGDTIASRSSVSSSNVFLGSSTSSGGSTVLTFLDHSTMILVGITITRDAPVSP
ncbi:MAG TPA: hypothetical protein VHW90_00120 [Stellaceae bacterium]|nr:hypothetical protein [Stellaceae bacterium]